MISFFILFYILYIFCDENDKDSGDSGEDNRRLPRTKLDNVSLSGPGQPLTHYVA